MSSIGELACTYACLILHDDGIPINAEKIGTLIKASNLKVESYWPSLFAKLCEKVNVDDLVMNVGAAGNAASTNVAAHAPTADNDASTATSDKKEEVKEESDDEAMFSLFD